MRPAPWSTSLLAPRPTTTSEALPSVLTVVFSPPGRKIALSGSVYRPLLHPAHSSPFCVQIWDVSKRRIRHVFQGHKSEIYSLAFSPDGRMLVSGSGDKSARVWDMDSGHCVYHLLIEEVTQTESGPMDAGVTSVAVSPDGSILAAGSLDTVVRLWDMRTGHLLDMLRGHKDSVYSVAFAPDGTFLVSGSLDKTLKMWDLTSLDRSGAAGANIVKKDNGDHGERVTTDRGFDFSRSSTICTTTLSGHKVESTPLRDRRPLLTLGLPRTTSCRSPSRRMAPGSCPAARTEGSNSGTRRLPSHSSCCKATRTLVRDPSRP